MNSARTESKVEIVTELARVEVFDFDAGVAWYKELFGREPDRRPMPECVEWQLSTTGGIQVYRGDSAPSTVIVGVTDAAAAAGDFGRRGINADVETESSGSFTVATVHDPEGNTTIFAEQLKAPEWSDNCCERVSVAVQGQAG